MDNALIMSIPSFLGWMLTLSPLNQLFYRSKTMRSPWSFSAQKSGVRTSLAFTITCTTNRTPGPWGVRSSEAQCVRSLWGYHWFLVLSENYDDLPIETIENWVSMGISMGSLPSGYLLQFAMERSTILKNGKPSISMGHGFHGYVSHNQRVHLELWWLCEVAGTILNGLGQSSPNDPPFTYFQVSELT